MSTISISPSEGYVIEAGPFEKMNVPIGELFRIAVTHSWGGYDDDHIEADILLERSEVLSLGYGLLAMCGVQV